MALRKESKRIIEFVVQPSKDHYVLLSIDADEIVGFQQSKENLAVLMLSNGKSYNTLGKHRNLVNRWIYCLEKSSISDIYHDDIIRPSIRFYNNNLDLIESDSVFLDPEQLKAFITVIRPDLLKNKDIMDRVFF